MTRTKTFRLGSRPAKPTAGAASWLADWSITERLALLGLCGLVAVFAGYNLEGYPHTSFDEGANLQLPKNLLLYGQYGTRSGSDATLFDPFVSTGPAVLLPIFVAFRLFGLGLLPARVVMALFFVAAVWAFYQVTQHLFSRRAALVGSLFWLSLTLESPVERGRYVFGEVPGMFYLLVGMLLWMQTLSAPSRRRLLLAGSLFGLAVLSKNIFILIVPALVAAWVFRLPASGRIPWQAVVLPAVTCLGWLAAWYGLQLAVLGWQAFADNLALLRSLGSAHMGLFSPPLISQNLRFIADSEVAALLGLPGLVYVGLLGQQRTVAGAKYRLAAALCGLWLIWFVVASIGWTRYAFVAFTFFSLFTAGLLGELSENFRLDWQGLTKVGHEHAVQRVAKQAAVFLLLLPFIAYPLALQVQQVAAPPDLSAQAMAAYVDAQLEPEAMIETWAWEIAFLTSHATYHHPSGRVMEVAIRSLTAAEPGSVTPSTVYDFMEAAPDYVIVGRFEDLVDLYPNSELEARGDLVATVGPYRLWKIRKEGDATP